MNAIVLEHPRLPSRKHFNDIANTPLWSCLMGGYVAARLRQAGHGVMYWDAPYSGWDFEKTKEEILRHAPELICINAVYFWEHTGELFDFLGDLRENGFDGHINLFGFFPSLAWRAILREIPAVDSIAVGECEETLAELADQLQTHRSWRAVAGLAVRTSDGKAVHTPRLPEKDPDRFPFPLRQPNPEETASILASRGCYNHCSFCPVPSFYNNGPLWRGRSPQNVFQEIEQLVNQGTGDFYFVDPNFIGPGKKGRQRTLELMELIRPLEITFGMETRPQDLDDEILESMLASGFQSLLMGIESGSESVLGKLNKSASRNAAEEAIERCRAWGIEPEVGFLMFVPDSTVDDLRQNLEFLERNRLLDRLERTANLLCHYQIVLMGTSGYERFARQGRLQPEGLFGFEGEIAYLDPAVKWMADLVIHACLSVLKDMSRPESPVYWKTRSRSDAAGRLNNYLVDLFKQLLEATRKGGTLPPVASMKEQITRFLQEVGLNIID